ncbi:cysteine desulfurase family protein [Thioalkalivibrio sp. ALE12]|uniref:cysteine desulfurase family protein n=1 Tax=Thioalkalivibrio sp. ALE12 TaxID=1158170 RepID=UPI00057107F1|nr:cysteine desulfurase family protein [Thioalkalivibrio sp. ALE12]
MASVNLDNNATTCPSPAAVNAATAALSADYGNPSSAHGAGDLARTLLVGARTEVAELLRCDPEKLIFTGSGTEANNLAIHSLASNRLWRLVTTPIEHSSVIQHADYLAARGLDIVKADVRADGRVDLESVESALRRVDHPALSVQWVNNETGAIQPVEELVDIARRHGARVHIDAAQAVGKLPCDVEQLAPDFLSCTAHKINGIRGVGALYAREPQWIQPMRFGGMQEQGIHPGTENLAGIAAFGAAARERRNSLSQAIDHMRRLRDAFEDRVLEACPWAQVNATRAPRVCNTTNIRFSGIDGEALMARLDGEGIYCSQSSACTNQKPEPSFVLRAMGLSESEAYESVRFSMGVMNTQDEVVEAADAVVAIARQLRRLFA